MTVLSHERLVKVVDQREPQVYASHFAQALAQFALAIDHKKNLLLRDLSQKRKPISF